MRDKIFSLIVLGILLVIPIYVLCRKEKDISVAENRSLFKKADIKLSNLNDDIESLFEDQFLFGETLKKKYNIAKNKVITFSMKLIEDRQLMKLIPIGNKLYRISNTDYLVYGSNDLDMYKEEYSNIINRINELSRNHKDIKFYIYNHTVESTIVNQDDFNSFIKENLDESIEFKYSTWINSYDEYQKYFYKTDHHWNKDGSYMGYKDIASFLNFDNVVDIKDVRKIENIKFYGSKSRVLGKYDIYDDLIVNVFEYPEMDVEINYNKVNDYGKAKQYLENSIGECDVETNHYGEFYGWDDGIIKFTVEENKDKENILIFSNSYSNAINKLIASNYNETYVVDMRNYEVQIGEKFNFDDFVKEHHIDKVLIIGNDNYYRDKKNYIE